MEGRDGRHITPTNHKQWAMRDSNPHSMDYESTALTVKLIALIVCGEYERSMNTVKRLSYSPQIVPESPHSGVCSKG